MFVLYMIHFSIGVWASNGIPIKNNVVYNTYESAIVVSGKNNIVEKNLVTMVHWSGQARPEFAALNINHDGAIMSRKATSVIMRVRLTRILVLSKPIVTFFL